MASITVVRKTEDQQSTFWCVAQTSTVIIDESMVPYRGLHSAKQFEGKPSQC